MHETFRLTDIKERKDREVRALTNLYGEADDEVSIVQEKQATRSMPDITDNEILAE